MSKTIPTQIPAPSTSEYHININSVSLNIGVAREVPTTTRSYLTKFLEHIVILWFERRYHKQNSFSRLESSIWTPPIFLPSKKFWAGYATVT